MDKAKELFIYIVNSGNIYNKYTVPYIRVLNKKWHTGEFLKNKAVILFEHLAEIGAKEYCKECCTEDTLYYNIYNKKTRTECAELLLSHYSTEIKK